MSFCNTLDIVFYSVTLCLGHHSKTYCILGRHFQNGPYPFMSLTKKAPYIKRPTPTEFLYFAFVGWVICSTKIAQMEIMFFCCLIY